MEERKTKFIVLKEPMQLRIPPGCQVELPEEFAGEMVRTGKGDYVEEQSDSGEESPEGQTAEDAKPKNPPKKK